MVRRRLCIIFAALAGLFLLAGCSRWDRQGLEEGDGRLVVAATLFPYYDFVREVAGDAVTLKLIIPAGMDSHSFEPTPADMAALGSADIVILNGGELELWAEEALKGFDTTQKTILRMMDYVSVLDEEIVEGMEDAGEGHSHTHEAEDGHAQGVFDEDDGHAMDIEYDEHIWTSPVNAIVLTRVICEALSEACPENAALFEANAERYIGELTELDAAFRLAVSEGRHRMIVVADRFPFLYFAREYGLSYRAAFSGCSGEAEPSAKTIAYLIDRVKENHIEAVYYLELSSPRTAQVIEEETGAVPLLLHSCHNVTRLQFNQGVTYLGLMRDNLENLKKGLR